MKETSNQKDTLWKDLPQTHQSETICSMACAKWEMKNKLPAFIAKKYGTSYITRMVCAIPARRKVCLAALK